MSFNLMLGLESLGLQNYFVLAPKSSDCHVFLDAFPAAGQSQTGQHTIEPCKWACTHCALADFA